MVTKSTRVRTILAVSLLGLAVAGGYGYTKYSYARTVSSEIASLKSFDKEKIELIAVQASEKTFTLQLSISGITSTAENIETIKSYYDDLALNYACGSSSFRDQFDEGYQVSFDIKYSDQPDMTFKKTYVSKEQCARAQI